MIRLTLHEINDPRPLKTECSLSSGREYVACLHIETERYEPIEGLQAWLDIELNGQPIYDTVTSETDENGMVCATLDILPTDAGRLDITATISSNIGMQKVYESWSIDPEADYQLCVDNE